MFVRVCVRTGDADDYEYDDEAGQYGVRLMDDIMPVDPVRWPGALDLREPRLRLIGCHIRTSSPRMSYENY